MTLIERFKYAWRHATDYPSYNRMADQNENWTDIDGKRTYEFYNSETGLKLKDRLTNFAIRKSMESNRVLDPTHYSNGKAQGVLEAIAFVEDHFAEPERIPAISDLDPNEPLASKIALQ
jgi:hypothetical protein